MFCTGDELYLTVGAAAALCCCLFGLHTPGDEFIVIVPYFTEYRVFIESAGAKAVEVPAAPGTFDLDLAAIEAAIGPNTKGILINSPNNPAGVVYPAATIRGLADLLRRKSSEFGNPIYLISDEPYREVVYDGVEVPWLPAYYENTLVCYSYSKCLSLPGEPHRLCAGAPERGGLGPRVRPPWPAARGGALGTSTRPACSSMWRPPVTA